MILNQLNRIWELISKATYCIYRIDTASNQEEIILEFDSIVSTHRRNNSEITTVPIETGFQATDYKFATPGQLEVVGVLSRNSALGRLLTLGDRSDAISSLLETLDKYTTQILLLNIQTRTGLCKNYTLKNYEIDETKENYGIVEVSMEFEEVIQLNNAALNNITSASNSDTKKTGIAQIRSFA